jgi:hypothetical protein
MEREYVGIDFHRRRSVIVRLSPSGERLSVVRVDNDPVALAAAVAEAGPEPEVVIEATYGWYWAVDADREAERPRPIVGFVSSLRVVVAIGWAVVLGVSTVLCAMWSRRVLAERRDPTVPFRLDAHPSEKVEAMRYWKVAEGSLIITAVLACATLVVPGLILALD